MLTAFLRGFKVAFWPACIVGFVVGFMLAVLDLWHVI